MKTSLYKIVSILAFALVFNCSPENSNTSEDLQNVSELKINAVLQMSSQADIKLAYSLLNENEKFKIWKDKFEKLINNGTLYGVPIRLTDEQMGFIEEINKELKVFVFINSQNDEKEYFKNVYVNDFLKRSTGAFDNESLYGMIFYEITVPKVGKLITDIEKSTFDDLLFAYTNSRWDTDEDGGDSNGGSGGSGIKECNCQKSAFFSCYWGQHDDKCKTPSRGCKSVNNCGFAWAWECDAICVVI